MPDNANYQIKWQYENLFLLNKKKKKQYKALLQNQLRRNLLKDECSKKFTKTL